MEENVIIVLVEPIRAGNIGSVARAMKNMGITELRLVNPREFPHVEASIMAVHAKDVLNNACTFSSLEEALVDIHVAFGTSARSRYMPKPFFEARQASKLIANHAKLQHKVAVVFGREDKGLSNEELNLCHFHIGIQADPSFSVLNLSHAVQIVTYLIYESLLDYQHNSDACNNNIQKNNTHSHTIEIQGSSFDWDKPPATHDQLMVIQKRLLELMQKTGFYDCRKSKLLDERLQRLLFRVAPDEMEANIILGILSETIKKIP